MSHAYVTKKCWHQKLLEESLFASFVHDRRSHLVGQQQAGDTGAVWQSALGVEVLLPLHHAAEAVFIAKIKEHQRAVGILMKTSLFFPSLQHTHAAVECRGIFSGALSDTHTKFSYTCNSHHAQFWLRNLVTTLTTDL